jgi:hypothetical protein
MDPRTRWASALLAALVLVILGGGIATAVARSGSSNDSSSSAPGPTSSSASGPASAGTSSAPTTSGAASPGAASSVPATGSSAPIASPTAPANGDLFVPPASWFWVPDSTAGTGPVDVTRAAELDGVSALSSVGLSQLGFVRGVTRQWQDDGTILVDLVYTFQNDTGARSYAASTAAARASDSTFTSVPAGAGSPAGAVSFTTVSAESHSRVIVFSAGTHAVVLGLVQNGAVPDAGVLAQFAAAQAAVSTH